MPALTVKAVVKALRTVPEKKFRIMELVPQILDEKGKVDVVKAMGLQGDLSLAIVEVETYIKSTRQFRDVLGHINNQRTFGSDGAEQDFEYDMDDEEDGE